MGFLGDVVSFEGFNGKKLLKEIGNNPTRLLTGVDPASTRLWNKVLGTHNDPLVDQWGGATKDTYKEAEAAGINTKAGRKLQDVAHVVAAIYAANGLAGAGGAGTEGGGLGGTFESGGLPGVGGAGLETGSPMVGDGMASGGWDLGSLAGNGGAGGPFDMSSGLLQGGGGGASGAAGSGKFSLQDAMRMGGGGNSKQPQQEPLKEVEYDDSDLQRYLQENGMVPSSKKLKTPRRSLGDAISRGVSGQDPVDSNGVEVAAIQALDKRFAELLARAQKLVQRKKGQRA